VNLEEPANFCWWVLGLGSNLHQLQDERENEKKSEESPAKRGFLPSIPEVLGVSEYLGFMS